MARLHSKSITACSVNAVSVLPDLVDLTWNDAADMHDTTTLGDTAHENTAGLKGGDAVSLNLFYNNTVTTGCYALLTGLLGGSAVAFSWSDGTRTTDVQVIVSKLSVAPKTGDMVMMTAELTKTGNSTYS